MPIERGLDRASHPADRATLWLSAMLLLVGQLLYILVTQFHAGGDANNHRAIFVTYARSGDWTAVHVGQFVAFSVIVAGLVLLAYALDLRAGPGAAAARVGVILAGVALGLYAVLQAVDGVGNRQVDAAWANASAADKPARFASAEAMRWLEWGVRSYHDYALGLALILLALVATVVSPAVVPRGVTWLMGLSGAAYLAQGWVVGEQGFSGADTTLILLTWVLSLAWMIWLVVATRRTGGVGNQVRRPEEGIPGL
jgi:hypothetical protein